LESKPRETSLTQLGLRLPVNCRSRLLPLHSIGQHLMPPAVRPHEGGSELAGQTLCAEEDHTFRFGRLIGDEG
jgi:hypothetical protein